MPIDSETLLSLSLSPRLRRGRYAVVCVTSAGREYTRLLEQERTATFIRARRFSHEEQRGGQHIADARYFPVVKLGTRGMDFCGAAPRARVTRARGESERERARQELARERERDVQVWGPERN